MLIFLCAYLAVLVVCNGLTVGVGDEPPPPTLQRYFTDMEWYPLDCSERSEGGRSARIKFDAALSAAVAAYTKESATFTHIRGARDALGKLLVERSELATAAFTANYELLSTMSAMTEQRRLEHVSSSVFGDAAPTSGAERVVAVLEGGIWPACDYQRSSLELRARSDGPSGYTAVRDVLGHLARDFQTDGGRERDDAHALYEKVVNLAVNNIRATMDARCTLSGRANLRVLVPGVGVGGLLYRLQAALSHLAPSDGCEVHVDVVGTECSPSMLVALGWVSNWHMEGSPATIHPWAWHQGNMLRVRDMYVPASISPAPRAPAKSGVSVWAAVVGGDVFAEGWDAANASFQSWIKQSAHSPSDAPLQFDVILTSYVVDAVTSSGGVTNTLDRIAALLRPSGHWVNFGPLQYHSEEQHPKLSAEELLAYMSDVHGMVPDRPLTSLVAGAVPYSTPPTVGLIESRHLPLLFSMGRSL